MNPNPHWLTIRHFWLERWMDFWGGNVITVRKRHRLGTPILALVDLF